jgi:hypothetical protein
MYKRYVSGVVLANASLDIAFHDTVLIVLFSIFILNYFTTLKSYKDSLSINSLIPKPKVMGLGGTQQALNDNLRDSTINEVIDYNEYIKMF